MIATLFALAAAAGAVSDTAGPAPAQAVNGGRDWVYTSDYPRAALAERRGGVVTVRLTVTRNGEVAQCAIAQSSGFRDLDDVSCMAMTMRGRYVPARNARGRPVESEVLRQIVWDPRTIAAAAPAG